MAMGAEGSSLDGERAMQPEPEAPTFPAGRQRILCPACGGTGYDDTYLVRRRGDRCRTCQGWAYLWMEWRTQVDGSVTYIQHGPARHPDQGELAL
jgi:hypothetical protein